MKTGLITSDTFQNHDTGPGHPEQIARVSVIVDNFKKLNNINLIWKKPTKVSDDIILTTHETNYLNLVKNSFPKKGFASLDGDTIISPGSKGATFDAVGSIITAIDGVEKKRIYKCILWCSSSRSSLFTRQSSWFLYFKFYKYRRKLFTKEI